MNMRYFQFSLGHNRGSPNRPRFKGEELKFLVILEKWKTSDFVYSIVWIKKPSSIKERVETRILYKGFLVLFSNI